MGAPPGLMSSMYPHVSGGTDLHGLPVVRSILRTQMKILCKAAFNQGLHCLLR